MNTWLSKFNSCKCSCGAHYNEAHYKAFLACHTKIGNLIRDDWLGPAEKHNRIFAGLRIAAYGYGRFDPSFDWDLYVEALSPTPDGICEVLCKLLKFAEKNGDVGVVEIVLKQEFDKPIHV